MGNGKRKWGMRVRDLSISIAKLNGLNKEKKVEKRSETSVKVGGSGGREKRRPSRAVATPCGVFIHHQREISKQSSS